MAYPIKLVVFILGSILILIPNIAISQLVDIKTWECKMIEEINLLRSNPKGYIKFVDKYKQDFMNRPYGTRKKKQFERYYRSLIEEIKELPPLSQLTFDRNLYSGAKSHGAWLKRKNKFKHKGKGDYDENLGVGELKVRYALIKLLIDAGVSGKGHRKAILKPLRNYVGISYVGTTKKGFHSVVVQRFR